MIRRTSVIAYKTVQECGLVGKRQKEAYNALYQCGPRTTNELLRYMADEVPDHNNPNLHARLNELRAMELVEEVGTKVCSITGMTVTLWNVTDNPPVAFKRETPRRYFVYTVGAGLGVAIKRSEIPPGAENLHEVVETHRRTRMREGGNARA